MSSGQLHAGGSERVVDFKVWDAEDRAEANNYFSGNALLNPPLS